MQRRKFNKTIIAGATASLLPYSWKNIMGANDRINIGVIGCNGMGWSNVNALLQIPEVQLVGIADVDQNVIDRRLVDYAKLRNNKPKTYGDYRQMLDDQDIHAVVVGSPDHWHCMHAIHAMQSGKSVYVEKPISLFVEEANLMVAAAKKYGSIVQVGQWQRSGAHYRDAINLVRSGELGNIRLVKVWAYQGWMKPVNVQPDSKAPAGVDYKTWLGPAAMRPFNANRFHFNFRWFWDYAGGLMTDWGVHEIDIALYAMGVKSPISVMASGGKLAYPNDASETPDTLQAVFQYEDFNMLWEHATGIDNGPYGRREGIAFIGNNGTLVLNRQGYDVIEESMSENYSKEGEQMMKSYDQVKSYGGNAVHLHAQNFVDAMKANDASLLNTPIESGAVAAINAQMGNIAFRTGRKIFWDDATQGFKGDKEATKMTKAKYSNRYALPKI